MSNSVFIALNQTAELFGRAPLSEGASALFYRATEMPDESAFIECLLALVKTSERFPLPCDFAMSEA